MSLVVFLLLFVAYSNASLEELETRMNRKFLDMERLLWDQNKCIQKLEHTVASQKMEINELNSELANVKMQNSDKIEFKGFREQLNRKVDPTVHNNLVHLVKSK